MNMGIKVVVAVSGMLTFGLLHGDEIAAPSNGDSAKTSISIDSEGKTAEDSDKAKTRPPRTYDVVRDLPDDAVFLKVGDDDIVRWGDMRKCVDSIAGVQLRGLLSDAANGVAERPEMNDIQISMYGAALTKMLRAYLLTALVAQEAKKEGLTVSEKDIEADIATLRRKNRKLYGFQYQLATNLVYQRAYIDKHIRPNITVSDDEIETVIKLRHESNLSVPLTNAIYRAEIEDLRKRLVSGELEFGEAAEEYSECTECSSNNGDCGPWEEDVDNFDPVLKEYCFSGSTPTNVLSEVIDGTDAYHLVKIKSRYTPSQKARDEDGEVSSVEVKHIQIDKWLPDPEYTRETAIKFITDKKIVFELTELQENLKKTAKIESVLPLYDTHKRRGRTYIAR